MRFVIGLLSVVAVLGVVSVVVSAARECDMAPRPGGTTVSVRATGEDITERAGAYARACLGRVFRGEHKTQAGRAIRSLQQL